MRRIFGYGPCEALASHLGGLRRVYPLKRVGRASCDTRRQQALIHSVFTVIAFEGFPCLPIPLRSAPRTGSDAGFTAYAQRRLHKYDAVRGPLLHSACWARRNAPGVFAVKARHEDKLNPGNTPLYLRANRNYLAKTRAYRHVVLGLAVHLARPATYAPTLILIYIMLTHCETPSQNPTAPSLLSQSNP